ncbi:MAG: hypothetical protein ABI703_09145 [Gemmatimonadales bacterium]
MYLVELRLGKEELYRTGDELALAIRNGDVDARSRIYHRATAKWISITLHPQYKAIVSGQTDEPLARPARKGWGLFPAGLTGQGAEMSSSDAEAAGGSVRHRWKRPSGLGLAGLLLLLGIQLASSGPRPPWAAHGKAVAVKRHLEPKIIESSPVGTELISLASSTTVWPATAEPASNTISLPAAVEVVPAVLPRAPRLRAKALRSALQPDDLPARSVKANSVEALLRDYEAASDEVRARLEGGLRVARLNRLFAPGRLSPGGGVTDTRLSLAGAVNFIRVYRQQQAAVEKVYQDSVDQLARLRRWTQKDVREWHSRPVRKEPATLELVSESLVAGIDSILGVLDAQAGTYKVRGTAIAFEDPAASQAYAALRSRIKEQIDAAVAAGAATTPGPTSLLLQAIGTSTLPRET